VGRLDKETWPGWKPGPPRKTNPGLRCAECPGSAHPMHGPLSRGLSGRDGGVLGLGVRHPYSVVKEHRADARAEAESLGPVQGRR
jgi:hypothetical protein